VNLAEKIRELDRRRQAFQALIESGRPRRLRDREEAFEEVVDRRIDAEEVVDEALVAVGVMKWNPALIFADHPIPPEWAAETLPPLLDKIKALGLSPADAQEVTDHVTRWWNTRLRWQLVKSEGGRVHISGHSPDGRHEEACWSCQPEGLIEPDEEA
jgi:hypothetical protein